MPHLVELQQQYNKDLFTILAIAVPPDNPKIVARYAARHNLDAFPLPLADETVQQRYQVASYPSSFFIDRRGNVRYAYRGFWQDKFAEHIEELLAE